MKKIIFAVLGLIIIADFAEAAESACTQTQCSGPQCIDAKTGQPLPTFAAGKKDGFLCTTSNMIPCTIDIGEDGVYTKSYQCFGGQWKPVTNPSPKVPPTIMVWTKGMEITLNYGASGDANAGKDFGTLQKCSLEKNDEFRHTDKFNAPGQTLTGWRINTGTGDPKKLGVNCRDLFSPGVFAVKLIAQWKPASTPPATTKTIKFELKPDETCAGCTLDYTCGPGEDTKTIIFPKPTKTGSTFDGWTATGWTKTKNNQPCSQFTATTTTFAANWTGGDTIVYNCKLQPCNRNRDSNTAGISLIQARLWADGTIGASSTGTQCFFCGSDGTQSNSDCEIGKTYDGLEGLSGRKFACKVSSGTIGAWEEITISSPDFNIGDCVKLNGTESYYLIDNEAKQKTFTKAIATKATPDKCNNDDEKKEREKKEARIKELWGSLTKRDEGFFKNMKEGYRTADGNFNTNRLLIDAAGTTIVGAGAGILTNVLIKNSQLKSGYKAMQCTFGNGGVAAFGERFILR